MKDESMCIRNSFLKSRRLLFLHFRERFIMYISDLMGMGLARNLKLLRPISKALRVKQKYEEMSKKKLRDLKGLRTFSQVHETTTSMCVKRRRVCKYSLLDAINCVDYNIFLEGGNGT